MEALWKIKWWWYNALSNVVHNQWCWWWSNLLFFHCCFSSFKLILCYLPINSIIAYQTQIFKFPTHLCLETLFWF
jgi:hypothetical protein